MRMVKGGQGSKGQGATPEPPGPRQLDDIERLLQIEGAAPSQLL
jgi:hypothetical protein